MPTYVPNWTNGPIGPGWLMMVAPVTEVPEPDEWYPLVGPSGRTYELRGAPTAYKTVTSEVVFYELVGPG